MPVDKRSRAHPRRDRSWEKVRQSEANLVTGIRSTPDGDRSPLSRHAEESTLLYSGQAARVASGFGCYFDRKRQIEISRSKVSARDYFVRHLLRDAIEVIVNIICFSDTFDD